MELEFSVGTSICGLVLWHHNLMLRGGDVGDGNLFAPEEEQSVPLRSSKSSPDCSSSGFTSLEAAEDEALKYLAEVLVESFLLQKNHGNTK